MYPEKKLALITNADTATLTIRARSCATSSYLNLHKPHIKQTFGLLSESTTLLGRTIASFVSPFKLT